MWIWSEWCWAAHAVDWAAYVQTRLSAITACPGCEWVEASDAIRVWIDFTAIRPKDPQLYAILRGEGLSADGALRQRCAGLVEFAAGGERPERVQAQHYPRLR
jgi:hypothetical protein